MKTTTIIINAAVFFLAMTLITGFIYPLAVTAFAQAVFPFQANGSLLKDGNTIRGSRLLAQGIASDRYFHGRPSAGDFTTVPSGASNLSPAGKALSDAVAQRKADLQKLYGNIRIPADLLYASASGLDPDISLESALLQVDRVSTARKFSAAQKSVLTGYILGNPESHELFPSPSRINIMDLNMALDTDSRFTAAEAAK
jgi:potassium-transporting ATPase KdpC subunit